MMRALTILFVALCLGVPASAQAIGLWPSRSTDVLDPGQTKVVTITIQNDESIPIVVEPVVDAVRIDAQTNRLAFDANHSADEWVQPLYNRTAIGPGGQEELSFAVSIPSYAQPGSYPLALMAEVKGDGDSQINVSARVASLFFLYVAGEVQEELQVASITLSDRLWHGTDPLVAQVSLENNGGIQVPYQGVVELMDSEGTVLQVRPITRETAQLFAGERVTHAVSFFPLDIVDAGKISVRTRVQYGTTDRQVSNETAGYFIPLIAIIVGLTVTIFIIVFFAIRRFMKPYYEPVVPTQR